MTRIYEPPRRVSINLTTAGRATVAPPVAQTITYERVISNKNSRASRLPRLGDAIIGSLSASRYQIICGAAAKLSALGLTAFRALVRRSGRAFSFGQPVIRQRLA